MIRRLTASVALLFLGAAAPGDSLGAAAPGDPALFGQIAPEMAPGGVDRTGVHDATKAIQWAEDEAGKSCGTVVLTGRYLQDSADIVEPPCVATVGGNGHWPGADWPDRDYSRTQGTLVQNPAYTFRLGDNASVERLTFQREGLAPPRSFRDLVSITQHFAGTALTADGRGNDTLVRDVLVLGYDRCLASTRVARLWLEDFDGDCTTGVAIDNAHDIAGVRGAEFYPFLTYNTRWAAAAWPVEAVGDDGRGQVRLTLGRGKVEGAALAAGDTVNVIEPKGVPELTRAWRIAAADATHVVLEGSHYRPGYAGGGTVRFEELRRSGDGVRVTASEAASFSDVFVLGHDVGFHNGSGAQGTTYVNDCTDNDFTTHDPATIGYLEDGGPSWASWVGGCLASQMTSIKLDRAPDAYPGVTTFTGLMSFGAAMPEGFAVFAASGRATLTAVPSSGPNGRVYIGDAMKRLMLIGNDWWSHPEVVAQSPAALSHLTVVATPLTRQP